MKAMFFGVTPPVKNSPPVGMNLIAELPASLPYALCGYG
jgi:hypothetical protein